MEDPSTAESLCEVADAQPDDAITALEAASEAQVNWAKHPPRERGEILPRAFETITERIDELALLMTLEMASRSPTQRLRSPMLRSSSTGTQSKLCASMAATRSRRMVWVGSSR